VRASERLAAKKARRVPYELSEPGWTDDEIPEEPGRGQRDGDDEA
jgi:GTP-binding protein